MNERLIFLAQHYDIQSTLIRDFHLIFYHNTNQIELYDIKYKKLFLKKTVLDYISVFDLYVSSVLTIFNRKFTIIQILNEYTENYLKQVNQNLDISLQVNLNPDEFKFITQGDYKITKVFFDSTQNQQQIYLQIIGQDCLDNKEQFQILDDNKIFQQNLEFKYDQDKNSILIIKEHILKDNCKLQNLIKDVVQDGFKLIQMKSFKLSQDQAEEFLEIYDQVVEQYKEMVFEIADKSILVVLLEKENCQQELRKLCGNLDPQMAQQIQPNSLRAKYGETKGKNAVHCTDLQDDIILELDYFYKIVQE